MNSTSTLTRQRVATFRVAALLTVFTFIVGTAVSLPAQALPDGDDGLRYDQSFAQAPPIAHNTWTKGASLPTPVFAPAAALFQNEIYVIGGASANNVVVDNVQIYTPSTKKWSTGVPYPTAIEFPSLAVVNSVLYGFGGSSDGVNPTAAVWAYNSTTKKWSSKAPLPTARWGTVAVVEKGIIYVIGGSLDTSGNGDLATVESYNPSTNTWKEEASLLVAGSESAAALFGTTIVVADGGTNGGGATGENESYNAVSNQWTALVADPLSRYGSCFGAIGGKLYDAGGANAPSDTEAYQFSSNTWASLAAIPQSTIYPASAVYENQLYCFGGWASWEGSIINNTQIYQP